MKNISNILLVLVLFILSSSISYSQNWTPKSDIPIDSNPNAVGRFGALSFSLNGKIYVGGGIGKYVAASAPQALFNDFYEYDPNTDKWTRKADLPGVANNRTYGAAFAVNNKGYIGMGIEGAGTTSKTYFSDLWEYNPSTDKWTQKSDMPLGKLSGMSTFVIGNKAYLLGGENSNNEFNDLWEYDASADLWTQRKDYPGAVYITGAFTFSVKNKGYVSCGAIKKNASDPLTYTKKTFEYDPSSDTWTSKADFPGDVRESGTSFVINNLAFCGLGVENSTYYRTDFFEYDAQSDKWTSSVSLPTTTPPRASTVAGVVNHKAYFGGGWSYAGGFQYFKDFYEFSHPISITTVNKKNNMIIYPNPVKDVVYINSNKNFSYYRIFNSTGELVIEGALSNVDNIHINSIPRGLYILQLMSDDEPIRKLIIVE